jgi:uncharacterized protein (TIGR00645 family)
MSNNNLSPKHKSIPVELIENVLFNVKWVLPFFYIGLVVTLLCYGFLFAKEIFHLVMHLPLELSTMKIIILDFVDTAMIANLIKMIITGSYNSFISKEHGRTGENISSGTLKLKIMTSIIVVAAMTLLNDVVSETISMDIVWKHVILFGSFLIGALILGVLEYIHVLGEKVEHEIQHNREPK